LSLRNAAIYAEEIHQDSPAFSKLGVPNACNYSTLRGRGPEP
jgi:hypothetical protein